MIQLATNVIIKEVPAINQLGYCTEPDSNREIEIEIMLFDKPVLLNDMYFHSIIRTRYTDSKVIHGVELYQNLLSDAQCTEAIKNISANPNNFKNHGK